jgi:two-component system sensor histidine kinase AgrC
MQSLIIINFSFVLLFGIALSLSFANIGFTKNKKQYFLIFCSFGMVQTFAYLAFGDEFMFKAYPLLIHFPLFLLLRFYYKRNMLISGISVLSAYLFCTPRKWFGTLVSYFYNYSAEVSYIVQIIITIPLLIVIVLYIKPYVARLRFEDDKVLGLFISVPLIYYVLEYYLTVYTDLLYQGGAVIVEFMDAAVVVIYFIFSIIYLKTLYEKKEIELEQTISNIMANQSKNEIEALRKSQNQASIYRHDLRHHLNYLKACISKERLQDASEYIENVCKEIDSFQVIRYSENESINLIISAYIAKANERKIQTSIKILTSEFERFSIPDLCSLLLNALENAIHAAEKINDEKDRQIKLRIYSKNNKLCINLSNNYKTKPTFSRGLPVTKESEHGVGTKSMIHIVEKYSGIYRFIAKDGVFVFQATM